MGQANSEGLQSRSLFVKNWLPMERDANLWVHRVTQEQVQRHFIRILLKDLPRETALFSARMTNHHPHVCRLLYFHPSIPEQKDSQDYERDFREMFIYTDRILPMRIWNRERVLAALKGLRRLISIHGPIKITERMIGENQLGEVKVWISENPVNNHPDSKYMSEEQSMGDFAAILTKKNKELANFLMGCITLKQAFECLSLQHHQSHSPHHNYSHRASGSGDFKRRLQIKGKNLATPYKNVFGSPPDNGVTNVQGPITPKNPFKNNQKYPQSLFLHKQTEKCKPVSQMNDLNKYRDFLIPKRKLENDNKIGNKSIPKLNAIDKLNETSHEVPKRSTDYFPFNNSHSNKSFAFQQRFQTVSSVTPSTQNYFSKNRIETNWSDNNQINNVYSSQSQYPKDQKRQNGFKEQKVKAGGLDITIINNNVNNYISNVTHNHITKIEKTQKDSSQLRYQTSNQFKNYSRMANYNNHINHISNHFMKQSQKTREKQYNIPVFLQQKKKSSTKWAQESAKISQKIKNNNLSRKNTVSSNPSFESPQFSSENNLDRILEDSTKFSPVEERFLRSLNLSKDNESSINTQKMTSFFNLGGIYPLTPTPVTNQYQGFTSFQKSHNNFQFKFPIRTKTMQFYQQLKGSPKNEQLQNKSFTISELQKNSSQIKVNDKKGQSISTHIQLKLQITKNVQEQQQQKKSQNKLQFKKQLRNQFKNLLGGDVKQKQQQSVLMTQTLAPIEQKQKINAKQTLEGSLKQKINRKKTAFAELKKEALNLLIDE